MLLTAIGFSAYARFLMKRVEVHSAESARLAENVRLGISSEDEYLEMFKRHKTKVPDELLQQLTAQRDARLLSESERK